MLSKTQTALLKTKLKTSILGAYSREMHKLIGYLLVLKPFVQKLNNPKLIFLYDDQLLCRMVLIWNNFNFHS